MIEKGFINGEEYGDKLEWLKDVVATAQQHVSYAAQVPDDVAMYFTDNFDFENEDAKNRAFGRNSTGSNPPAV